MKLVKLHKVEFDEETLYVSDIPLSAVSAVVRFEESGNKDFGALAELLKAVLKEKDGSSYKQFKDMTADEIADSLPAASAIELFGLVSEVAMGKL